MTAKCGVQPCSSSSGSNMPARLSVSRNRCILLITASIATAIWQCSFWHCALSSPYPHGAPVRRSFVGRSTRRRSAVTAGDLQHSSSCFAASTLVMAALWNRAGHYIFVLCGLSVNLECRSETCCARLTENTARKKSPKSRHWGHHPTTLSDYIFATKACIDNRKKLVKQQYLLHMSS